MHLDGQTNATFGDWSSNSLKCHARNSDVVNIFQVNNDQPDKSLTSTKGMQLNSQKYYRAYLMVRVNLAEKGVSHFRAAQSVYNNAGLKKHSRLPTFYISCKQVVSDQIVSSFISRFSHAESCSNKNWNNSHIGLSIWTFSFRKSLVWIDTIRSKLQHRVFFYVNRVHVFEPL